MDNKLPEVNTVSINSWLVYDSNYICFKVNVLQKFSLLLTNTAVIIINNIFIVLNNINKQFAEDETNRVEIRIADLKERYLNLVLFHPNPAPIQW